MSTVDAEDNWQLDPELMQMHLLSTYWQPEKGVESPAANVTWEPNSWTNEPDDFFGSTAQIGQMLGFCRSCASVSC